MVTRGRLNGEVFVLTGVRAVDRAWNRSTRALIVGVSGDSEIIEAQRGGLPAGPAGLEALAVRLQGLGARLSWSDASDRSTPGVVRACREWGAGSVTLLRDHPELLGDLAIGSWFDSTPTQRALRRAARRLPVRRLGAAMDVAFWRGVASEATAAEWHRLTRGYTALLYHRLAGELKPGQERLDVPPGRFDAQMRLLRRLGFGSLDAAALAELHAGRRMPPSRAVVVTFDDAFAETVEPLLRHAPLHPLVFVPTADVGTRVGWLGGEEVASWEQLQQLAAAGVGLGGHTRTHRDLAAADDATAEAEVRGSYDDLRERLGTAPVAFAYPHGRFLPRDQVLAREAGYSVAFTTRMGRNGVGTDPFALRRVSVKAWDSSVSFAWKLFTGEQPPAPWERWLLLRAAVAARLGRALRRGRGRARAAAPPGSERGQPPAP